MQLKSYIQEQVRQLLEANFANQDEIDYILDKVASQGLESLTRYERMRLDGAGNTEKYKEMSVSEWIEDKLGHIVEETIENERHYDAEHHYFTMEGLKIATLYERSNGAHRLTFNPNVFKEIEIDLGKNYGEICMELNQWVSEYHNLSPITVQVRELD